VPHPKTHPRSATSVRREVAVTHQAAKDNLPLLSAQPMGFRSHNPISGNQFTSLTPTAGRPDEMVLSRCELGARTAGTCHRELETLGLTIITNL
jgi:hypothetical protein